MNYAFDCILGIPWLARYQPVIDWLSRLVKRRRGFGVSVVFTRLLVAPRDWSDVAVFDKTVTTQVLHRASDGPLCMACAVLLHDDPSRCHEGDGKVVPQTRTAVEHGFPQRELAVEHELPLSDVAAPA
ncbi:hypothetical protein PI125_g18429 [Phytophthora idaei]|nr:hypothetical protein PI125_g18429 [Phytophthora idaei]